MDHFWRKPVSIGVHQFIGHTSGFYKPWGETVKFDCYLIDSYGRHWNLEMVKAIRETAANWQGV